MPQSITPFHGYIDKLEAQQERHASGFRETKTKVTLYVPEAIAAYAGQEVLVFLLPKTDEGVATIISEIPL